VGRIQDQPATNCDDTDRARIIQEAAGIESDVVVSYCLTSRWPPASSRRHGLSQHNHG
jgi:hypothetical protein